MPSSSASMGDRRPYRHSPFRVGRMDHPGWGDPKGADSQGSWEAGKSVARQGQAKAEGAALGAGRFKIQFTAHGLHQTAA